MLHMSGALSERLTTVEELRVTFEKISTSATFWEGYIQWRRFYQQFPSVKALRTDGPNDLRIASTLLQAYKEPDDVLGFLPALEEIDLGKDPFWDCESELESRPRSRLAAFQPFVSARQQTGRPVKVIHSL
jgi:hypothetical protein